MDITVTKGDTLLNIIRKEIVEGGIKSRNFPGSRSNVLWHSDITIYPQESIFIPLFVAVERLKTSPIDILLSPSNDKGKYKYMSLIQNKNIKLNQKNVDYKKDSLGLDVLPEKDIVETLLSPETYESELIKKEYISKTFDLIETYKFNPLFFPKKKIKSGNNRRMWNCSIS